MILTNKLSLPNLNVSTPIIANSNSENQRSMRTVEGNIWRVIKAHMQQIDAMSQIIHREIRVSDSTRFDTRNHVFILIL